MRPHRLVIVAVVVVNFTHAVIVKQFPDRSTPGPGLMPDRSGVLAARMPMRRGNPAALPLSDDALRWPIVADLWRCRGLSHEQLTPRAASGREPEGRIYCCHRTPRAGEAEQIRVRSPALARARRSNPSAGCAEALGGLQRGCASGGSVCAPPRVADGDEHAVS
jgi:hypothetical protein